MPYSKPLPTVDPDTKEYWEAARKHKLVVQRCAECGYYCFPPYPICPQCNSSKTGWVPVTGRGKIYSWAVVHSTKDEAFKSEVPYVLVMVELNEQAGLRMVGRLVNWKREDLGFDKPVEVVFEDVTESVTLLNWRVITQTA